MAHFAKLDENNIVTQVITFSNKEVNENGGDLSIGVENFVSAKHGGKWKQTSYNSSFRKKYTGIGDTYDSDKDIFISPQPFPSWTLDTNSNWKSPIDYPTIIEYDYNGEPYKYLPNWNETTHQTWVAPHGDDTMYKWNGSSWEQITPVITHQEFSTNS
tara:strand:+ start:127 stop:600 length:474 start_codon:yes stop_codon:yes gene_type:complete